MGHDSFSSEPGYSRFRRRLLPILTALLVATTFFSQAAAPASASIGWCRSDPVLLLDLAIADVFVSAKWEDLDQINGPTKVVIVIPSTVKSALAIPTLGFGYGELVSIERSPSLKQTLSKIELRIKVFVPSNDSAMPIMVDFTPRLIGLLAPTTAYGTANSWITFKAVL